MTSVLLSLASNLNKFKGDQREQKQEIQLAISNAFHNTEKYYTFLENGSARDREREYDLARDWECASIFVGAVDPKLANRLGIKGAFWREGATWSQETIEEAGIQLARVRAEGMSLFGKK